MPIEYGALMAQAASAAVAAGSEGGGRYAGTLDVANPDWQELWGDVIGTRFGGEGLGKVAYWQEAQKTGLPMMSDPEFVALGYGSKEQAKARSGIRAATPAGLTMNRAREINRSHKRAEWPSPSLAVGGVTTPGTPGLELPYGSLPEPTAKEWEGWEAQAGGGLAMPGGGMPSQEATQYNGGEAVSNGDIWTGVGLGAGAGVVGFEGETPGEEEVPTGVGLGAGAGVLLPALAGVGRMVFTSGPGKTLLQKLVQAGLIGGVGAGAWTLISNLFGLSPGDAIKESMKKHRRRYTIGGNPRVRTLAKVSRHCQRLLKRHEKVIREFLPKKRTVYGQVPSRMLSAAEKALIKG